MKTALAHKKSELPAQLIWKATWDRGEKMSPHAEFNVETGIPVFLR